MDAVNDSSVRGTPVGVVSRFSTPLQPKARLITEVMLRLKLWLLRLFITSQSPSVKVVLAMLPARSRTWICPGGSDVPEG